MADDMAGGLKASRDLVLPTRPEQPECRESVSMWISDDQGRFGLPRFCIEAFGAVWDDRGVEANIAFPDGRVLVGAGAYNGHAPEGADGAPRVFGAGPLKFECIDPFRHWTMSFHGPAFETTIRRQVAGELGGPSRQVDIEVDAVMAAPPWFQGQTAESQALLNSGTEALFVGAVGGDRHEQLFRCRGDFRIEGEPAISFTGTGLRIHRVGVRDTGDFRGHVWQSAVFPSGKAFGMVVFPPQADGSRGFSEAFVFDGQRMLPARVAEAAWMTEFTPHGGPVDLVLESEAGRTRIAGVTHDSTFILTGRPMFGDWTGGGRQRPVKFPFHQGGAHYTWDGESAYGMIERSLPQEQIKL